jgi:hypothetical protein
MAPVITFSGAVITILLNILLIPKLHYLGCRARYILLLPLHDDQQLCTRDRNFILFLMQKGN